MLYNSISIPFIFIILLSSSALACLIPDRCMFPQGIECLEFEFKPSVSSLTLRLLIRPQIDFDNLSLYISEIRKIDMLKTFDN